MGVKGKRGRRKNPLCVWSHIACVESQVMLARERFRWALVQEQSNPLFVLGIFFFVFIFVCIFDKDKGKVRRWLYGRALGEL